jgi:hypothetical protein
MQRLKQPAQVSTAATISRTTTVSAGVFHGVKPGEDPLLTTMWVQLGDPKFSIAVPCWAACESLTEAVSGEHGGAILPDSLRWLWRTKDVDAFEQGASTSGSKTSDAKTTSGKKPAPKKKAGSR